MISARLLGFCVIALSIALGAEEQVIDLPQYAITIATVPPASPGGSPTMTLSIRDKRTGELSSVELVNYTTSIEQAFVPHSGELVVLGGLESGGKSVNVIEVRASRLLDFFRSWRVRVSHNLQYAAYDFRFPGGGPPGLHNSVLLLYDFNLPPPAIPRDPGGDPTQVGFILYPDNNRVKGRYLLAPGPSGPVSQTCCSGSGHDERMFTSPIAWSEDDKKIAVLEGYEGKAHLVVVDIADGPLRPRVSRWEIDIRLFFKDIYKASLPEEYKRVTWISASRLAFVDNSKAVLFTSREGGPFAEATVRLSLSDGKQAVLAPRVPAVKHLELPEGLRAIRVGAAVQETALIRKAEPQLPAGYKAKETQVTVEMEALIGPDGRVQKVLPISGPPELYTLAEEAVKRWLYQPLVLDGEASYVVTTIAVRFNAR